ncbi:MAG TPA: N-methyl-L-tryptophan oxidase [Chloroflexota bacterium]|nr:N-methyl-L-tryptophan oxidase [Chloroflexota bacterium]
MTEPRGYDAIVVGVGGMGSAAAYHLARRGLRVLGLERFDVPHELGSSHGITRIIRLAYYEHPSYVPLLRRAYQLWRELQGAVGEQLLYITGSLDAGPAESEVVRGSKLSCDLHGLEHELIDAAEIARRWPGYRLPRGHVAVHQPEGGFLLPERCVVGHVTAAQAMGAEVRARERVLGWEPRGDGVRVRTERAEYEAGRLVVTAGPWIQELVAPLRGLAQPERQVLAWLQPLRPEHFALGRFPVFNMLVDEGRFYGFPVFGIPGFKFGCYHHLGEQVDPDTMEREPNARDEALLRAFAERYFPGGAGPTMALKICIFTNSPDEHFTIDLYPGLPQVAVASPCSGHGFKFCSVVGEILADLAQRGETRHEIGLFRLGRFAGAARC